MRVDGPRGYYFIFELLEVQARRFPCTALPPGHLNGSCRARSLRLHAVTHIVTHSNPDGFRFLVDGNFMAHIPHDDRPLINFVHYSIVSPLKCNFLRYEMRGVGSRDLANKLRKKR